MLCFSMTQTGVRPPHEPRPCHCPSLRGHRPAATSDSCLGWLEVPQKGNSPNLRNQNQLTGNFSNFFHWLQVYWWSEFFWFTNLPKLQHAILGIISSPDTVSQTPLVTRFDERHVSLCCLLGQANILLRFLETWKKGKILKRFNVKKMYDNLIDCLGLQCSNCIK